MERRGWRRERAVPARDPDDPKGGARPIVTGLTLDVENRLVAAMAVGPSTTETPATVSAILDPGLRARLVANMRTAIENRRSRTEHTRDTLGRDVTITTGPGYDASGRPVPVMAIRNDGPPARAVLSDFVAARLATNMQAVLTDLELVDRARGQR
jgi:hypothetical protein